MPGQVPPTPTQLSMPRQAVASATTTGRSPPTVSIAIASTLVPPTPASLRHAGNGWDASTLQEAIDTCHGRLPISFPDASLLGIDPSSPVLRDLTVFDIANRDPRLPGIYVYTGDTPHPQHRVQAVGSRTFVYLTDPSEEGKTAAKEAAHSQTVPGGIISDIPGQFEVLPGDAVFARPIDKAGNPAHDCLQIMFGLTLSREYTDYMRLLCTSLDRQEHFSRMLDDVEQAKDVMLGSRDRRVKMKGVLAFESSRRAKPMKNAPRCYSLNNMVQQPRNLESPPAPLKTRDDEHDWYQLNVNCYLAATTALNVAAWELQGPSDLLHACREYGEQVNSPRLGHCNNYYWVSQQNNCARPQYIKKEKQLVEQMGHFGGPHEDENDFTAGLSCGLCLSDLSDKPGCEPGRLHFLGVGCWVRLQYMAQIFFSGLLRHGGTSPLVPDKQPMEGWETRMLLISYLATKILTGEARRSFSSMPYQLAPLYITPEMTGAPASQQAKAMWTTHTTYAQDAWVGMEPLSLVNFMARSALQHLHFAFRQLPSSYGVQIDAGQFLKAFSLDFDGHRVNADPWELAPNSNVGQPFGERHKQVQDELLQKQSNHYLAGIPLVSHNKYHGWDITAINHGETLSHASN
ncbi:hypothetical protein BC835DRAFT_1419293 [Cytidiella melzeri]|nr:hypothetical protein BC835DRAFT_1419293 [Cytidiella melzeri]